MKTDFNFDKVGKRMPYSVPRGFFDQLENNILHEVRLQPEDKPAVRCACSHIFWIRSVAAVAAMIALVWLGDAVLHHPQQETLSEVEQAFSSLSDDDQEYMLSVYQDDLFMND